MQVMMEAGGDSDDEKEEEDEKPKSPIKVADEFKTQPATEGTSKVDEEPKKER